MREPAIMFRLPSHVRVGLDQVAERFDLSANIIAKLIVTREVTRIPVMLDEHDRQLANMHQFLRELAFRNEDFLEETSLDGAAIMQELKAIMATLDAIRDASFVRPSSFITDPIRRHDDRSIQRSFHI